jgi:hypothetical protein
VTPYCKRFARGTREIVVPLAERLEDVFLLAIEDKHSQRSVLHVELMDEPLIRHPRTLHHPLRLQPQRGRRPHPPRFASLDGDPARLVLLRGVLDPVSAQPAPFNLRDTPMLEDALERTNARLLIIHPLHSYFWAIELHRHEGHGFRCRNRLRQ